MIRAMEGWHGWDEYAPFYDWENAQTVQRRDVAFWRQRAVSAGGPVLMRTPRKSPAGTSH